MIQRSENAQALISVVTPFTSSSAVADLGDIAPGQSAVASYQISVSGNAVTKLYGLDSEIRYRDALDDTYVSDPMKVSIDVENLTGIEGIMSNTVILSIIVAALIGLVYAIWLLQKKTEMSGISCISFSRQEAIAGDRSGR